VPVVIATAPVTLTSPAQVKLRALLAAEARPDLALRLLVTGGGCSGFQYGMALDDRINPDDSVTECGGLKVVIDPTAIPYVQGSEIDYVDTLMGAGFIVHNPNVVHSCSCGHSFDTGDGAGQASPCSH
jgi:iron-sulfur cluster assembly protein